MPVSILGINHKTAPVSVREKVAFAPQDISVALQSLRSETLLNEVAIISTCNRMEIVYRNQAHEHHVNSAEFKQIEQVEQKVLSWLAEYHQLASSDIHSHCYQHHGESAINHLMSVACGLDSMVLGEPQILGQVKDAFGYAKNAGTVGLYLNRLFQQTFSLAKQVRTDTQIGESAVSVAYAAVTLAKRIFDDFSQVTALFIGAGETIELAARHLQRQGVVDLRVANRTVERAQLLASEFAGTAHSLAALPELIEQADIVISSTASPIPVIGKGLMEKAIIARKHRSMFMVDLAVPRDIEPEVAELNDVYLYTVDDMQGVIQENLKLRQQAAIEAADIVSLHVEKYNTWLHSLSSVSLLKSFRNRVERIKQEELERAIAKIEVEPANNPDLNDYEKNEHEKTKQLLNELANRLTQKFLHEPSQSIRKAGEENDQKTLKSVSDIFGLDE
jgi:glutamyl-tRNA reductase